MLTSLHNYLSKKSNGTVPMNVTHVKYLVLFQVMSMRKLVDLSFLLKTNSSQVNCREHERDDLVF